MWSLSGAVRSQCPQDSQEGRKVGVRAREKEEERLQDPVWWFFRGFAPTFFLLVD